jgi:hypothetical protein
MAQNESVEFFMYCTLINGSGFYVNPDLWHNDGILNIDVNRSVLVLY